MAIFGLLPSAKALPRGLLDGAEQSHEKAFPYA